MPQKHTKHETIAFRLADIITRLNNGERLCYQDLMDTYKISKRTAQRDLQDRLAMLMFSETGKYYRLDKTKQGYLSYNDVQRFANFASIQDLLPDTDRRFFQEHLIQSILVKGFEYENIKDLKEEFDTINEAIAKCQLIEFDYSKVRKSDVSGKSHSVDSTKHHILEPYRLLNKNGIWYVVGVKQGQQRIYCFTQISNLEISNNKFTLDEYIKAEIDSTDSLFFGNRISEIVVQVSAKVAGYFERRPLLPNQETIRKLENGDLLLASKNVNPREVVPIVQYWIPHIRVISPSEVQGQMEGVLREYLYFQS